MTFKPGQSGNPEGRPKGARNRATVAAERLLDGEADTLTRKAIELAKKGDTTGCGSVLNGFCQLEKTARYRSTFHALRRLPTVSRQRHQSLLLWLKAN
jgi:DNA transposition AAA+ family ATPase